MNHQANRAPYCKGVAFHASFIKRHFHTIFVGFCLCMFQAPLSCVHAENTSSVQRTGNMPLIHVNGKPLNNMFGLYVYCTGVDPSTRVFLENMKDVIRRCAILGIPVISFDILWSDYDKSTDVPVGIGEISKRLSTDNLDKILDEAAAQGVFVVLQVPVHAHWGLPRWWKAYASNANACQLIDAKADPSGDYNRVQSPVASFGNPVHRQLLDAFVGALVSRYRSHPAVIGWGINPGPTGENGYAPNYIEMRFNPKVPKINFRNAFADYSPFAREQFSEWLRNKYGTVKNLNNSWNSGFSNFKMVEPPTPKQISTQETFLQNGDSRPSMLDWQNFRSEALLDEWRFVSESVRKLDPHKIVIGKTSWNPFVIDTGSRAMLDTAARVHSEQLIDADKIDAGITLRDYVPEFAASGASSLIDYHHYALFGKKRGIPRIFCLENWCRTGSGPPSPGKIPETRALRVKDFVRNEGAYLWFVVSLAHDTHPRPAWSWNEISSVVKHSSRNELSGVSANPASVAFLFSVEASRSHYNTSLPRLQINAPSRAVAGALFSAGVQYTLVDEDGLDTQKSDLDGVNLLVVSNRRLIPEKTLSLLRDFVARGGSLLLLGSNGVFRSASDSDPAALQSLVPGLTAEQRQNMLSWGCREELGIPVCLVRKSGPDFIQIPFDGEPSSNYSAFSALVGQVLKLPARGFLNLEDPYGDPSQRPRPAGPVIQPRSREDIRKFISEFDKSGTGIVRHSTFPGPDSVFQSFDLDHDGMVTVKDANLQR